MEKSFREVKGYPWANIEQGGVDGCDEGVVLNCAAKKQTGSPGYC